MLQTSAVPYAVLRGHVIHRLLPELFGNPNWVELSGLSPTAFQNRILEISGEINCRITQTFLRQNPEAAVWITGCYRILLKCLLRDWRVQSLLVVEPRLPQIELPDGKVINCGVPDMLGDSQAFDGLLNIEMKSGYKKIRKQVAKLARYNSGASMFAKDTGLNRPMRGTVWISFSSTRCDAVTGRYTPSNVPVMNYAFEPFNADRIDTFFTRKFGVELNEAEACPRYYA